MKHILITGATGAIGKATAIRLAHEGHKLILLGRNKGKLHGTRSSIIKNTGNENIDLIVADLSVPSSIINGINVFKQQNSQLDVLLNIAAVYTKNRVETEDGLELMFATNHLGPFILVRELMDLLKESSPSRVVTVSAPSTTKLNFDDLQGKEKYSSFQSFGGSKIANLLFTFALARRLEGSGVTASVFHPGLVKSNLTKEMPGLMKFFINLFSQSPYKATRVLAKLATSPEYESSNGLFIDVKEKERKAPGNSGDETIQEQLWDTSEHILSEIL